MISANPTDKIEIQLSRSEFSLIERCLSHVFLKFCMGQDYSFSDSTGCSEYAGKELLQRLRNIRESGGNDFVNCAFTKHEAQLLGKVVDDCVAYIDKEFQTLLSYTIEEAKELKKSIADVYEL